MMPAFMPLVIRRVIAIHDIDINTYLTTIHRTRCHKRCWLRAAVFVHHIMFAEGRRSRPPERMLNRDDEEKMSPYEDIIVTIIVAVIRISPPSPQAILYTFSIYYITNNNIRRPRWILPSSSASYFWWRWSLVIIWGRFIMSRRQAQDSKLSDICPSYSTRDAIYIYIIVRTNVTNTVALGAECYYYYGATGSHHWLLLLLLTLRCQPRRHIITPGCL